MKVRNNTRRKKKNIVIRQRESNKNLLISAIELAKIALTDWARTLAPEEFDEISVQESRNRLQESGTLYYISTVQETLQKALNGN